MSDPSSSPGAPSTGAPRPVWLSDPWPGDLYPPRRPLVFVLSGPSGVGKDAVLAVLKSEGCPLHFTVTMTTRPRRPGEIPGVSYQFVEPAEFARLRDSGELLEWAVVHGYEYGTPRRQVQDALAVGRDVLLKIDVQGAAQVKARAPDCVFVFLGPGSRDELLDRLARRGTETAEDFRRRVADAEPELRAIATFDYVIVNREGRLAEAARLLKAIIEAERLRVRPRHCDLG